jgi:hypothetical protein
MVQILSIEEFHLRLASDVIFLNADLEPVLAGFAHYCNYTQYRWDNDAMHPFGSVQWMTPDALEFDDGTPDRPRMVYQFGTLVRFLLGGEVRFTTTEWSGGWRQTIKRLSGGHFWDRPEDIPDAYWEFIKNDCCNVDRSRWPTFQAIVDRLTDSTELIFPGTDMLEYARYRSRLTAERIDAAQAERVREALARYKQSHSI